MLISKGDMNDWSLYWEKHENVVGKDELGEQQLWSV
jgi:hypothetical protein